MLMKVQIAKMGDVEVVGEVFGTMDLKQAKITERSSNQTSMTRQACSSFPRQIAGKQKER